MDVSDASYYISIEKKKNKGSQTGHTKKNLKKKFKVPLAKSLMTFYLKNF
jgi:hypothetical protein